MNTICAIYPYRHEDLWVFDDEAVGLRQEPFVAGGDGGLGGGGTALPARILTCYPERYRGLAEANFVYLGATVRSVG